MSGRKSDLRVRRLGGVGVGVRTLVWGGCGRSYAGLCLGVDLRMNSKRSVVPYCTYCMKVRTMMGAVVLEKPR